MTTEPQPELIGTVPFDEERCVACGRFLKEGDCGPICRKCIKEDEEYERIYEYPK